MLTDRQLRHYRTFGFVVLRNLFTADEVATLRAEYEAELDLVYADQPFTGETRYWTMMLHPRRPLFAGLLQDDRFCSVAEQLYGPDAIGICTDANRYVGDTHWHPDHTADREEDCFGVKFAFYLDPVSADTGALRVIPGSHNRAYHEQVRDSLPALNLAVADVPAYVCASDPGDVVAFDMRCWHASHGGATGRRMATCVYYNNPRESKRKPPHAGAPAEPAHPRTGSAAPDSRCIPPSGWPTPKVAHAAAGCGAWPSSATSTKRPSLPTVGLVFKNPETFRATSPGWGRAPPPTPSSGRGCNVAICRRYRSRNPTKSYRTRLIPQSEPRLCQPTGRGADRDDQSDCTRFGGDRHSEPLDRPDLPGWPTTLHTTLN